MATRLWAGLDVGVETTSVCVIDDRGEVLHEATCRTDVKSVHRELVFLKRRRSARVGLETGVGTHLARGLRTLGYSVDVYETRQLSKFLRVRRNKTDAGDASGIAEAGRLGASTVSRVHLKNLECQSLHTRLAIRRTLIRLRVRAVNTLGRQLEQFGGRIGSCSKSGRLRDMVEPELKKLFGKAPSALLADLRSLLDLGEKLLVQQKAIDRELKQLSEEIDLCRRFMEIPGIGPICALSFYAAVAEPHRFQRTRTALSSGTLDASEVSTKGRNRIETTNCCNVGLVRAAYFRRAESNGGRVQLGHPLHKHEELCASGARSISDTDPAGDCPTKSSKGIVL